MRLGQTNWGSPDLTKYTPENVFDQFRDGSRSGISQCSRRSADSRTMKTHAYIPLHVFREVDLGGGAAATGAAYIDALVAILEIRLEIVGVFRVVLLLRYDIDW